MRRVTWNSYDGKKQYEGWLHRFITAADGDGINCVHAIVECDDGYIKAVEVGVTFLRFVTLYQPEARAKGSASDSAQDYGDYEPSPVERLEAIDEALAEVSKHSCARGIPPQERKAEICHPCTDRDDCIDCIPF